MRQPNPHHQLWLAFLGMLLAIQALALPSKAFPSDLNPVSWAYNLKACESLLTEWSDDFMPLEELQAFWDYHPRFGILKKDGRHYLITRDEAMNMKLQGDLKSWSASLGELKVAPAPRATLAEVGVGVIYDVTDLLPAVAREYHSRFTIRGNCWNFACFNAGVARGVFNMNDLEFTHWLSSPLARKLYRHERPSPGDVVAFRALGRDSGSGRPAMGEVHGATYISEDLVFSKNGAGEGMFRLQDAHEMLSLYGPQMSEILRRPIQTELFRLRPLAEYIAEHRAELSPEVLAALDRLAEAERLATFYHVAPEFDLNALPTAENDAFQEKWRQALRDRLAIKTTLKAKLSEVKPTLASRSEPERFLWKSIEIRVYSL